MEEMLNQIKKYIEVQVKENKYLFKGEAFEGCQKVYFNTNENIKAYLENNNFNDKDSALTVLASGDQSLNLIKNGVLNIDTFDINKFTEYYVFGIRFATILKNDYKNYLDTVYKFMDKNTSIDEMASIISSLLPFMEHKYGVFWKKVNDYNYKIQKEYGTSLNLISLLSLGTDGFNKIKTRNNYLSSEESFNTLKNNLLKTNITFNNVDALSLPDKLNKKYDFILLSNIIDYFYKKYGFFYKYDKIENYIERLKDMLNYEGLLFLHYIFKYKTNHLTRSKVIYNSNILLSDFKNDVYLNSFNNGHKYVEDAVLVLKKK